MICKKLFTKGHNSVKKVEFRYLFCRHFLIMLYICTKFCQSISKGFRITDPDSRVDAKVVANVTKGHNSVKSVG